MPKILISVPKKKYRKAVTRNRIKRQIREAYRLNKGEINDIAGNNKKEVLMGMIYSGSIDSDYHQIEKDIQDILKRIIRKINQGK